MEKLAKGSVKKKGFIWVGAILCFAVLITLGSFLLRERQLNAQQQAAIDEVIANEGEYSDSTIILQNVSVAEAEQIAERLGAKLRTNGDGSFSVLTLPQGVSVKDVYSSSENRDLIGKMALDYKVYLSELEEGEDEVLTSPNYVITEPDYSKQSYVNYINIGDVWNTSMGRYPDGERIRIAIIDSGIDTDHPDFVTEDGVSIISPASYNATDDSVVSIFGNDFSIVEDTVGHGTAVAGVIAAQINGTGTVGISPDVELVIIKCNTDKFGAMAISDVTFAIYYAIEQDVAAVNMSFGVDPSHVPDTARDAIRLAKDSDVQMIGSMGNSGEEGALFPACEDAVIAVGALDADSLELAKYSNYGNNMDIVAPGTVYTTAMGGGYSYQTGTSMSAPVVTAAVALYLTQNEYTTCEKVLDHITVSGRDLGDAGPDPIFGHGILDVNAFVLEEKGTVTFDYGTSELENDEYSFVRGHGLHFVPEPEREYVIFDDWYYDKGYTKVFDYDVYFTDTHIEDFTLYAKWVNEDDEATGSMFSYKVLKDGTAEITGYKGKRRYVTIPEELDGYTVTSIGSGVFSKNNRIRSVKLPDTLKNIGSGAFEESGLKNITFGNNLETIGGEAFCGTRISVVILPDSVKTIGSGAFAKCELLTYFRISESSELTAIGGNVFSGSRISFLYLPKNLNVTAYALSGCRRMRSVTVHPENRYVAVINESLYSRDATRLIYRPCALSEEYTVEPTTLIIDGYALQNSSAVSVILPEGLQSIGESAFYGSAIRAIDIPDTVTSLGIAAFNRSGLRSVRLSESLIEIPDKCFAGTYLTEVSIPDGTERIASSAFNSCERLEKVSFGDGVRYIEDNAFSDCKLLSDVAIPGQVKYIGQNAFMRTAIRSVYLPKTLEFVESGAFKECNELTEAIFDPECPVTELKGATFLKCARLERIVLTDKITRIASRAAEDCSRLMTVDMRGNQVLSVIEERAFYGASSLREIALPASLTELGEMAFWNSGITEVQLPAGFEIYGDGALGSCTSLEVLTVDPSNPLFCAADNVLFNKDMTVVICVPSSRFGTYSLPEGVTIVGKYAFAGDISLYDVILPESLVEIRERGFYRCGIKDIHITENVISIARYGFSECIGLDKVTFAENSKLKRLGFATFEACGFSEFVIPATLEGMAQYVFKSCMRLETVRFAAGGAITSVSAYIFEGCQELRYVIFEEPTSLTSIQAHAFDGLKSLEYVDIGDAMLTNIDNYSFMNCPLLKSIEMPEGVEYVGRFAFYGCSSLSRVDLPSTVEFIGEFAFAKTNDIRVFLRAETLPQVDENWDAGVTGYFLNIRDYIVGDIWEYTVTYNDTAALVKYKGDATHITVDSIDGYVVEKLGASLFSENKDILSVELADTVTEIDNYAFRGCSSLTELRLPGELLRIGRYAFANAPTAVDPSRARRLSEIDAYAFYGNTGTVTLSLHDSVISVGEGAFASSALEVLEIGTDSRLEKIGDGAFLSSGIKSIYLPSGLKEVGDNAFNAVHSLEEVIIADGDTPLRIGHNAFRYTAIKDIYIPARAYYIGEYAIGSCSSLNNINVAPGNPSYSSTDGLLFNIDRRTLIQYPSGRKGDIVIPKEVQIITYAAFMDSKGIRSVTFEEGSVLRTVGWNTFSGCTSLRSIAFPATLYSIDFYAFNNCSSLTEVTFDEGSILTVIGDGAFYNCISLKELELPETLEAISDYAFYGCEAICELPYMPNISYIGSFAFSYTDVSEYTLPAGLEAIADNSFVFSKLDNIYVEEGNPQYRSEDGVLMYSYSTDADGYYGVAMWPSNRPFVIGEGLREVTSLDSLEMPSCAIGELRFADTVITIGDNAFLGFDNIYSVVIDGNVETVGQSAFDSCQNLRHLYIGRSVKRLEPMAFYELQYLETIYFNAADLEKMYDSLALFDGAGLASGGVTVTFGKDIKSIPSYLFATWSMYYESNIRVIEFEEGSSCVSVGINAFWGCNNIEVVYWNPADGSFFDSYDDRWGNVYYPTIMALPIDRIDGEPSQNYPYVKRITYKGVEYYAYSKHDCDLMQVRSLLLPVECVSNGIDLYACDCGLMHHQDVYCHEESDYWVIGKEPECAAYGEKHTECVRCRVAITEGIIPMLGHDNVSYDKKLPTCTEEGWHAYSMCKRCEHITSSVMGSPFIAAMGHSMLPWVCKVEATCDSEGIETTYCDRCKGAHQERTTARREHMWSSGYDYKVMPTCTESGIEHIVCLYSDCRKGRDERTVAPLGHVMVFERVLTDPTCTEDGLNETKCSRSNCSHTGTVASPLRGHSTFKYDAVSATCISVGHNAYEKCRNCSYTTYEEYPAKGHAFGDWVITFEPTCSNDGSSERSCSRCSGWERRTEPATGHSLTYFDAKEPTCTEWGYDAYEACSVCSYTTYSDRSPTGHPMGEWVVDRQPAVGVKGHRYMPCSACGIVICEEDLEPTGDIIAFSNAMQGISPSSPPSELYLAILYAIEEYNALTEEERAAAAELYAQLIEVVEAYNSDARAFNETQGQAVAMATGGNMRTVTVVAALPVSYRRKEEL